MLPANNKLLYKYDQVTTHPSTNFSTLWINVMWTGIHAQLVLLKCEETTN